MKIRSSTKLKKLSNSVSVLRSIEDYNSKNCVKKKEKISKPKNFEMKIRSSTKLKKLSNSVSVLRSIEDYNSKNCVKKKEKNFQAEEF